MPLIPEDEEPQFSDTYEYLIYTPRFKDPRASSAEVDSIRRKLEGEASILYWKRYGLLKPLLTQSLSRLSGIIPITSFQLLETIILSLTGTSLNTTQLVPTRRVYVLNFNEEVEGTGVDSLLPTRHLSVAFVNAEKALMVAK
ncbi:hypothetical protein Tco_0981290 [Tanacetum coccineum]